MGESLRSTGPAVNQTLALFSDAEVNDVEITIRKSGSSWVVFGVCRPESTLLESTPGFDMAFAVNGTIDESTRVRFVLGQVFANAFFVIATTAILTGLSVGDRITLVVQNRATSSVVALAGFSFLDVVAFGPEFRSQGFLEDTG